MVAIGQQEVYDFLTRNKGTWYTSRDISEQLHVSIGSVTMSLKKLRKTSLIKYKNTGVRNTFIYTVEPEGVTVAPPPGIVETDEPEQEPRKVVQKQERIIPKIVTPKKVIPLVVPRPVEEAPAPAAVKRKKAAKPRKAKKAAKTPARKPVKARKAARPKKAAKPRKAKKAVKTAARRPSKALKQRSLFSKLKRMIRS